MRGPVLNPSIVLALSLLLVGVGVPLGPGGASIAFASGVPSDSIPPDFWDVVVLTTNSIHAKNGSTVVSGDLVANGASPGPVLASGAELTIGPKATTSGGSSLKADSVRIRANTQVGGDVHYNDLVNQGTVAGALVTPLVLPVFATLPPFAAALPGAMPRPEGERPRTSWCRPAARRPCPPATTGTSPRAPEPGSSSKAATTAFSPSPPGPT